MTTTRLLHLVGAALLYVLVVPPEAHGIGYVNSRPDAIGPPNNAPVWLVTPDIDWTEASPATYIFTLIPNVIDPDGDPIAVTLKPGSCTFPTDVEDTITTDAIWNWLALTQGPITVSGCIAVASDGQLTSESDPFDITINAGGALYVVNPATGNDLNNGSAGAPWATLNPVNSGNFNPGDIIELDWDNFQTSADYLIAPTDSGVSGNPITIRAASGRNPGIKGSSSTTHDLATFDGVTDWKVDGVDLGDINDWNEATEGSGGCSYTHRRTMRFDNSAARIEYTGGSFSGGCNYTAIYIDESTTDIWIHSFEPSGYHGTQDHDPTGEDSGDLIRARGATRCVIENGSISKVGHSLTTFQCNYGELVSLDLDQDWTNTTSNFTGARCFEADATWHLDNNGAFPPFGPIRVEDILCIGGGTTRDNLNETTAKFTNHRGILRDSFFVNVGGGTESACIQTPILDADNTQSNQTGEFSIYNITCYDTDTVWEVNESGGPYVDVYDRIEWSNNLATGLNSDTRHFQKVGPNIGNEGFATFWKGDYHDGNSFSRASSGDVRARLMDAGSVITTRTWGTGSGSANEQWPDNFGPNNDQLVPTYVNAAARTRAGFALALGSPTGIDNGVAFDTAVADYNGTTVFFNRPQKVYDGYNNTFAGRDTKMDCYKVGTNPVAQVLFNGVNHSSGAVTFDTMLTGSAGDPIWRADCPTGDLKDNRGGSQVDP